MSDRTLAVLRQIGIDPDDVESLRELNADLYYLRRQRMNHQQRVSMNWTTIISAIASAIVGAGTVLLSTMLHRGP